MFMSPVRCVDVGVFGTFARFDYVYITMFGRLVVFGILRTFAIPTLH